MGAGIELTKTFHSAAAAAANGNAAGVNGLVVYGIQVTGTFSGTITFEGTVDGTNWVALSVTNASSGVAATTTTTTGIFIATVAGLDQIRCRISTYTSGSITVTGIGSYVAARVAVV